MRPGQGTITSDPPVTAALLPIHATRTPSKKRQLDNQLFHSSDWHRLFLKRGGDTSSEIFYTNESTVCIPSVMAHKSVEKEA